MSSNFPGFKWAARSARSRPRDHLEDELRDSIVRQAFRVRRRMNCLSMLDALAVALSAPLLSLGLLAILAERLSAARFMVLTWALVAVASVVALACARRLRASWLSSTDMIVTIDHRAELADRMATLVSASPDVRRSRLWEHLRHENLEIQPNWSPKEVVPQVMPKSAGVLGFAMLLAALALYSAHASTAIVARNTSIKTAQYDRVDPRDAGATEAGGTDESSSRRDEGLSSIPENLQQALLGTDGHREARGKAPGKIAPVGSELPGAAAIVDQGMRVSGPVRSIPSNPDASALANRSQQDGGTRISPEPGPLKPTTDGEQSASQLLHGDIASVLLPQTSAAAATSAPRRKPDSVKSENGGGKSGAGTGGAADSLFGERNAIDQAEGTFLMDLQALRDGDDGPESGDATRSRVDAPLATHQRDDDAVRRAQIPAEYQGIVERIFNSRETHADAAP